MEATHGQTGDGTVSLAFLYTIGLLDKLDYVGEGRLERTLHRLRQHHRGHTEALAGLSRTSLLRDVAVGHDQNHRFCLALSNQVIHNLGCTTKLAPRILVTTNTM